MGETTTTNSKKLIKQDSESLLRTAEERREEAANKMKRLVHVLEEMMNPKNEKDLIELDSIY